MTGRLGRGVSGLLDLRKREKNRNNSGYNSNDPNLAAYTCANCGNMIEENEYGAHPVGQGQYFCNDCATKITAAVKSAGHVPDEMKVIRVVLEPQELHPEFLQTFLDEDGLFDNDNLSEFIDSLSPEECSIMKEHKNSPHILHGLKKMILNDFDESSKSLAMEG